MEIDKSNLGRIAQDKEKRGRAERSSKLIRKLEISRLAMAELAIAAVSVGVFLGVREASRIYDLKDGVKACISKEAVDQGTNPRDLLKTKGFPSQCSFPKVAEAINSPLDAASVQKHAKDRTATVTEEIMRDGK